MKNLQIPEPGSPSWAYAAWGVIAEPGDTLAGGLVGFFGPADALDRLERLARIATVPDEHTIRDVFNPFELPARLDKLEDWLWRLRGANIACELEDLYGNGGRLVTPVDEQYPSSLDVLGDAKPYALWLLGNPGALKNATTVGMVGSRTATRYGVSVARDFANNLSRRGITVVSGGAYGIDTAAHQGVLDEGEATITVQAGGLKELYPAMNQGLFEEIIETGGVIVSEQAWSRRPEKHLFLARNRLIAALSRVLVVVEAQEKSGSLNTARHATELGRKLAAIPGLVTSPASTGCHRLIRQGAALVASVEDIMELLEENKQ